jgi:hypothetical protein
MKKNFIFVLILLIIFVFTGCNSGGGNNSPNSGNSPRSGYYYMWSNNSPASAYTKPLPVFNSVVYAEEPTEPTKYLGSEIPPFASVDDANRMCGFLLIFTYYNGTEVKSICAVDPNDGEISEYDLNNGYMIPSFIAKRQGIFHVTATYNNEILDIPVRIYHFGYTNLNRMDFDKDGINDIQNFTALYGCRIIDNEYLSLVSSAPEGEYSSNTPLSGFVFGKIYIIKTSSGRYCKFWPTGYAGENSYTGVDFLSDENGNFAY